MPIMDPHERSLLLVARVQVRGRQCSWPGAGVEAGLRVGGVHVCYPLRDHGEITYPVLESG